MRVLIATIMAGTMFMSAAQARVIVPGTCFLARNAKGCLVGGWGCQIMKKGVQVNVSELNEGSHDGLLLVEYPMEDHLRELVTRNRPGLLAACEPWD